MYRACTSCSVAALLPRSSATARRELPCACCAQERLCTSQHAHPTRTKPKPAASLLWLYPAGWLKGKALLAPLPWLRQSRRHAGLRSRRLGGGTTVSGVPWSLIPIHVALLSACFPIAFYTPANAHADLGRAFCTFFCFSVVPPELPRWCFRNEWLTSLLLALCQHIAHGLLAQRPPVPMIMRI